MTSLGSRRPRPHPSRLPRSRSCTRAPTKSKPVGHACGLRPSQAGDAGAHAPLQRAANCVCKMLPDCRQLARPPARPTGGERRSICTQLRPNLAEIGAALFGLWGALARCNPATWKQQQQLEDVLQLQRPKRDPPPPPTRRPFRLAAASLRRRAVADSWQSQRRRANLLLLTFLLLFVIYSHKTRAHNRAPHR